MSDNSYTQRRSEIETYFDRTAADAWSQADLQRTGKPDSPDRARRSRRHAQRCCSAGCPTTCAASACSTPAAAPGVLAVEAGARGAEVLAVDLSATLIELARERLPSDIGEGHIDFRSR
jgi:magnesium-protoporphyrin O-methyltransferase